MKGPKNKSMKEDTKSPTKSYKGSKRSDIFRLRKWQTRSEAHIESSRTALPSALSEFDRLTIAMKLPRHARNLSSELIREAWTNGLVSEESVIGMVGAVIYAACRILRVPRKLAVVASNVGISEKQLARCYRKLKFGIDLRVPPPDAIIVVPHLIQKLKASREIQEEAIKILRIAKENDLYAGRDPWGLAAAAVYLASLYNRKRITQKKISIAADITEVTVRQRCQELRVLLDDMPEAQTRIDDTLVESNPKYWIFPAYTQRFPLVADAVMNYIAKGEWGVTDELLKNRRNLPDVGDWVCFYSPDVQGIVAHALVEFKSKPCGPSVISQNEFSVILSLCKIQTYLDKPIVIDAQKESELSFDNSDGNRVLRWLARDFHELSKSDFQILTRIALNSG